MSTEHTFRGRSLSLVTAALTASIMTVGAHAQSAQPAEPLQLADARDTTQLREIVVTAARKRAESIINVPVDEQAITGGDLQRMHITSIPDVATLVPGLSLGKDLLSIGTLISIRGVGTSSDDPGVDQSVSLNIDGLSLTNGLAYQSALFDLAQIEVLKGPQSLFYGKSNTGGVMSLRTADPTDQTEVIATAGYEFEADNRLGQLILSGPVADTVKMRLAAQFSESEGYFNNIATALPGTGAMSPTTVHAPGDTDYVIRLTTLWNPLSDLTARLKINYAHDKAIDSETSECTDAPTGTAPAVLGPFTFPNFLDSDPCDGLSRDIRLAFLNPADFAGILNGGVPFLQTNQAFGTLELNFSPAGDITYTSVTGYYNLSSGSMVNSTEAEYAGPEIAVNNAFHRFEFSEEVRADSDFKGPVNFTAGAYYEDALLKDHVTVIGNEAYGLPPIPLVDGVTPFTDETDSIYGQARWNITAPLQLSAGVRWSSEHRDESPYTYDNVTLATPVFDQPAAVIEPEIHSTRYSPEVDLTYHVSDDTTVYGAWKKGFKSGSFSTATPVVPGTNNAFGDEKANGGEFGIKGRELQGRLQFDATAFYYDFAGLQVGVISPPSNGVPVIQTVNAASARTYGLDLDAAYLPQLINGLTLHGSVEWDKARYLTFDNAPCWGGQTIAQGCNQAYNPAVGVYTAQNLSGTPLTRAPDWDASVGFSYVIPLAKNYTLNLSNSDQISSKFVTFLATDRPNNDNYQKSFAKVDLSMTLQSPSDFWEVAAIGRDLNNTITAGECDSAPFKTGATVPTPYGLPTTPSLGIDPSSCFADPGREVWLQVTVRPFAGR